jgi:glycerophosphoryl diester phosphodiesterase
VDLSIGCHVPEKHANKIIVIAHRGASGERPEHTLASYQRAIEQGADYIEPDLVMTRDGVLVARHEPEIGGTTDVADHPEFSSRRRTQVIDGETMDGWFTEDFTLGELKSLRARERLPTLRSANTEFDGRFQVPTFDEIMQLALDTNRRRPDRPKIGVYPETKHPAHFRALGLPQEAAVLETLARYGYDAPGSPVFIQSFDPHNLMPLRYMTRLPLVQLLEHQVADLPGVAKYADAIGIAKALATAETVAQAHGVGLSVHVWTFRAENEFLPDDLKSGPDPAAHGNLPAEIERYLSRGIDGFFIDFPAVGVRVRDAFAARSR